MERKMCNFSKSKPRQTQLREVSLGWQGKKQALAAIHKVYLAKFSASCLRADNSALKRNKMANAENKTNMDEGLNEPASIIFSDYKSTNSRQKAAHLVRGHHPLAKEGTKRHVLANAVVHIDGEHALWYPSEETLPDGFLCNAIFNEEQESQLLLQAIMYSK